MAEIQGPVSPNGHHREVLRALRLSWDRFERAGPDHKEELAYYLLQQAAMACNYVERAHKDGPDRFFLPYLPIVRSLRKKEDESATALWAEFKKRPKSSFRLEAILQDPFFDRLIEYLEKLFRLRESPSMLREGAGKRLGQLPLLTLATVKPWARMIAEYFLDDAIRHHLVSAQRAMSARKRRATARLRRAEASFNQANDPGRVAETRLKLRRDKVRNMTPTRSEYRRAFIEKVETRLRHSLRKDTKPSA